MTLTEKYCDIFSSLMKNSDNGILSRHRMEALEKFRQTGIPTHESENYKYSDFTKVLEGKYDFIQKQEKFNADLNQYWQCSVPDMDTRVILFSN